MQTSLSTAALSTAAPSTNAALCARIDERLNAALALGRVAVAFSGQKEDTLLLWRASVCASAAGQTIYPFLLDTGQLHAQTLHYTAVLEQRLNIHIDRVQPAPDAVRALTQELGSTGIYESVAQRQRCCHVRKVQPLQAHLAGFAAWVTGQRREQAASRHALQWQEQDSVFGLAKFNPLADFSADEVQAVFDEADAPPLHPLHERGYPSIGCEPCTRAIRAGEDLRAGRWWWEQRSSKECGLHQTPTATGTAA